MIPMFYLKGEGNGAEETADRDRYLGEKMLMNKYVNDPLK